MSAQFDISHLPPSAAPAVGLCRRLNDAGQRAYLVGGALRDVVLELEAGDWDVATDAEPTRLLEIFPGAKPVGASFGVMLVPEAGEIVEVATFRQDGVYEDGRRPDEVRFATTPEVDARRRDFTVNALYFDPVDEVLVDPTGGLEDIEARRLRCVGDPAERFAEDGLRLMRGARFAARCGLDPTPETIAGMSANAALIDRIAPERIGTELVRILCGGRPSRALELLRTTGVLERILPEVAALLGVPQPVKYHPEGCVWTHTMLLIDHAESPTQELALAGLLHDVGKPATLEMRDDQPRFPAHARVGSRMAGTILKRLRYSSRTIQRVCWLIDQHTKFFDVTSMREATLKRFLAQPGFDELLELHRLDRLAASGELTQWEFCRDRLQAWSEEDIRPQPLLTGVDLIRRGYPRGPLIGVILEKLETAQLEKRVRDRDEAMAWLSDEFPVGG